jgi:hypothetical protein
MDMNSQKIYECWPSDGYYSPLFDEDNHASAIQQFKSDELLEGKSIQIWSKWEITWLREYGKKTKPDMAVAHLTQSCSKQAALGLWPDKVTDFELLPFTVEGELWFVLRPLQWIEQYDPATTHIEWNGYKDPDGTEHRWISHIPWINIVDPRALQWDAFKLGFSPRYREFYTQRFVDRYEALGLKGVFFEHVGYVVDSAEHAVPPPPRPAPEVPQAPRWPRWREAPAKEKALVQSSGLAWLDARGLNAAASAEAVLAAITAEVEALRPVRATLKPKARNALFNGVGGAFALLLERDLQWRWVDLPVSSRSWGVGMASPNGSHALCLDQVVLRQMMASEPPTITLLFNMIAGGSLPPGHAGDYVAIG